MWSFCWSIVASDWVASNRFYLDKIRFDMFCLKISFSFVDRSFTIVNRHFTNKIGFKFNINM